MKGDNEMYKKIFIFLVIICLNTCYNENNKIYTISNDEVWIYVRTDKDGKLDAVNIYDTYGREISVIFTELGINNYRIYDEISSYHVETNFSELYFLNGEPIIASSDMFPPVYDPNIIINENAFIRSEKIGQNNFTYIIDYFKKPYFFIVEDDEVSTCYKDKPLSVISGTK